MKWYRLLLLALFLVGLIGGFHYGRERRVWDDLAATAAAYAREVAQR